MGEEVTDSEADSQNVADLTQYQSKNLFLLVGTNPLPNYIAGKLLLQNNLESHVFLVHSDKTSAIAGRISRSLKLANNQCTRIPVEEADASQIFEQIKNYARGKQELGLNYTGGTKAMAVHAYRAIQEVDPEATFSYLDAGTLELKIEARGESWHQKINIVIKPTIELLLFLHGYTCRRIGYYTFKPEICRALAKIDLEPLRNWCNTNLKIGPRIKQSEDLAPILLPDQPPFDAIVNYWGDASTLGDLAKLWASDFNAKEFKGIFDGHTPEEKVAEFLDGKWLEHYTLWAIHQVKSESQVHDTCLGFKPRERDFEFDIMAMRGYQLFAISCTTSSRKREVKSKLFEAFVRARQMGGDEARVGVVCGASYIDPKSDPRRIQSEIEEAWDARDKIRVFGKEDWVNLPEHLQEWFNAQ